MTEPAVPIAEAPADLLGAGHAALERHAWQQGFDLLARADRETTLFGPDLELLAEAAFRDYSGVGVNVTARVAALASGGQILLTANPLAEAGSVAAAEAREVGIRGVLTPLQVAAIPW